MFFITVEKRLTSKLHPFIFRSLSCLEGQTLWLRRGLDLISVPIATASSLAYRSSPEAD